MGSKHIKGDFLSQIDGNWNRNGQTKLLVVFRVATSSPCLFVPFLVMTSKRKPTVTMSKRKKTSENVKQRAGPLPVTLLSGFLVCVTFLCAAPPRIVLAIESSSR